MRIHAVNVRWARAAAVLGVALVLAVPAAASADSAGRTLTIPATEETRDQVGVETWKCSKVGGAIRVVGYGANRDVKAKFSFNHDETSASVESTVPSRGFEKRSRDGEVIETTLSAGAQRLLAAFSHDKDAFGAQGKPAAQSPAAEPAARLVPVNDPQICFRRSKGCWGIVEWCTDQDIFGRDCGGWYVCGWCFGFW